MLDNLMLGPMTKADKTYVSEGLTENLKDYCGKHFPGIDYNSPVRKLNNKIRMIKELQRRGICVVILSMSMADAETLDGDTLYMKNGQLIDEMEMYVQRY